MSVLSLKDLSVEFVTDTRRVRAVDDISFVLNAGDILAIVGESGSGKSTTALAVLRLLAKIARLDGAIAFQEENGDPVNLVTLPESGMQNIRGGRISTIFQDPLTSLNPVKTCGAQIIEAIRLHQPMSRREAFRRALRLMEEVRLPHPTTTIRRYPHELSGGQIQRVTIAMALAVDPAVLIADEPTTALDVTTQAAILDLLKDIRDRRRMSILFITHDLGVVADIADAIAVMYRGQCVELGPAERILNQAQHPYTKGLLACRPRLESSARYLPTIADFLDEVTTPSGEVVLKEKIREDPHTRNGKLHHGDRAERLAQLQLQSPLLTAEHLQVYFPKKGVLGRIVDYTKAVDDVSFELYPGETLGLVGESGCGKTTLGRALLRLLEPTSGAISFMGRDITHASQASLRPLRRQMQMIFQDPFSALDARLAIGQAISEPLRIHEPHISHTERDERATYLLDRVGLTPDFMQRYPHELSGGQCQRVCVARALALQPQLIVCDESVSALDVSVQAQVLNLLRELQDEFQLTYLFISHDLSVVKFLSDRIMVMNRGKIEEFGSAEAIFHHPTRDYTRQLIAATPKL